MDAYEAYMRARAQVIGNNSRIITFPYIRTIYSDNRQEVRETERTTRTLVISEDAGDLYIEEDGFDLDTGHYSEGFKGDYWNPPEYDWNEEPTDAGFNLYIKADEENREILFEVKGMGDYGIVREDTFGVGFDEDARELFVTINLAITEILDEVEEAVNSHLEDD